MNYSYIAAFSRAHPAAALLAAAELAHELRLVGPALDGVAVLEVVPELA